MPRAVGQHLGLGLDLLGGEDASYRPEAPVEFQPLDVARQLLHPVDLAAPFDLDRDDVTGRVAAEQIDGTDVSRVLPAHEAQTVGQHLGMGGEELLEMRLDAVLPQAGIDAEVVGGVRVHLLDA